MTKGYELYNLAYGVWPINKHYDTYSTFHDSLSTKYSDTNNYVETEKTEEIGYGDETVYVYYYPTYRKYAKLKGNSVCSQATTCFPEEPFVALVIRHSDAHKLEQTLHNILKMKGRWIESAPEKEWFLTSHDEVKSIYKIFPSYCILTCNIYWYII